MSSKHERPSIGMSREEVGRRENRRQEAEGENAENQPSLEERGRIEKQRKETTQRVQEARDARSAEPEQMRNLKNELDRLYNSMQGEHPVSGESLEKEQELKKQIAELEAENERGAGV